jgi:hypothetical protein
MFMLLAFLASAGLAQDDAKPDGNWTLLLAGPNGESVEMTLVFKTEGEKLTGHCLAPDDRKLPIEDGVFEGKDLVFVVKRDRPGGETVKYEMKGTIQGGEIKGTVETDMFGQRLKQSWAAKRKSS